MAGDDYAGTSTYLKKLYRDHAIRGPWLGLCKSPGPSNYVEVSDPVEEPPPEKLIVEG